MNDLQDYSDTFPYRAKLAIGEKSAYRSEITLVTKLPIGDKVIYRSKQAYGGKSAIGGKVPIGGKVSIGGKERKTDKLS